MFPQVSGLMVQMVHSVYILPPVPAAPASEGGCLCARTRVAAGTYTMYTIYTLFIISPGKWVVSSGVDGM